MKLVLLSGGSGKRLWPLSNDARSKQFLKVLRDGNGRRESMVQRVWRQLGSAGLTGSAIIATSRAQTDALQSQLGNDVCLVVEPERRDTFPAISLAAAYLHSELGTDLGEVVVVLPVDPYVDNSFFAKLKELGGVLDAWGSDMALIGVNPTYPSTKYGYIVPQRPGEVSEAFQVGSFTEKPAEERALDLISYGALWNCGVFAFKLNYALSILEEKGFSTSYGELLEQYHEMPKISFDYEVVERAKSIAALRYAGSWKDLGTWNTLTEEMASGVTGPGIISEDCPNTHVVNELDIPVAVLGLANVVVAVGPDGVLVADKNASPRVKELVEGFSQRPMYEERRWGSYRVLDYTKAEHGMEVLTKRICIAPGKNLSYQVHRKRGEVWTIIKGQGELAFEDELRLVKAGDVVQIPVGARHGIKAVTELEFIEVQMGSQLVEEDIERIFMSWEEVQAHCFSQGHSYRVEEP